MRILCWGFSTAFSGEVINIVYSAMYIGSSCFSVSKWTLCRDGIDPHGVHVHWKSFSWNFEFFLVNSLHLFLMHDALWGPTNFSIFQLATPEILVLCWHVHGFRNGWAVLHSYDLPNKFLCIPCQLSEFSFSKWSFLIFFGSYSSTNILSCSMMQWKTWLTSTSAWQLPMLSPNWHLCWGTYHFKKCICPSCGPTRYAGHTRVCFILPNPFSCTCHNFMLQMYMSGSRDYSPTTSTHN